jgi:hypothetical protein
MTLDRIGSTLSSNYAICTSSTHPPSPVAGTLIYETDTNKLLQYTTATTGWQPPWNLPWGIQAAPATAGLVTTSGGTEIVLSTSTAFTAVANRRLRIHAIFTGAASTVNDQFGFTFRRGTTVGGTVTDFGTMQGWNVTTSNSDRIPFNLEAVDTPPAGSCQYICGVVRRSGTGTFTSTANSTNSAYANYIYVEDIGPNGASA